MSRLECFIWTLVFIACVCTFGFGLIPVAFYLLLRHYTRDDRTAAEIIADELSK